MNLAPIVIFAYNRPGHIRQTIEALKNNKLAKESDLFVYSDAAKNDEAINSVKEVREYIKTINGFKNISIIQREINLGLAKSIIEGVTDIINDYGKIIVLEDDLIVSPFFLEYMNSALTKYDNASQVMQISGYMFPVEVNTDEDAFFLPLTTSWGWGTWKRVWDHFDTEAKGMEVLKKNKELRLNFNLDGAYNYYGMLEKYFNGLVDSWAIRFYLFVFLQNGLALYPVRTLILNKGFDGIGTHSEAPPWEKNNSVPDYRVKLFPERIEVNDDLFGMVKSIIADRGTGSISGPAKRIFRRLKRNFLKLSGI